MEKGIPDIVACMCGLFVGIELKAPGKGKTGQSEFQKIHERNIKKAGGFYVVVESMEDWNKFYYDTLDSYI